MLSVWTVSKPANSNSTQPTPQAWRGRRIDRMLVDYFRMGYYSTALELIKSSGLDNLTNAELFLVVHEVGRTLSC